MAQGTNRLRAAAPTVSNSEELSLEAREVSLALELGFVRRDRRRRQKLLTSDSLAD